LNFGRGKNEIGCEAICGNLITIMVGLVQLEPSGKIVRAVEMVCYTD